MCKDRITEMTLSELRQSMDRLSKETAVTESSSNKPSSRSSKRRNKALKS